MLCLMYIELLEFQQKFTSSIHKAMKKYMYNIFMYNCIKICIESLFTEADSQE